MKRLLATMLALAIGFAPAASRASVSLLGASDARIEYGDQARFFDLRAMTIAITVKVAGSPASGLRMFGQWGLSGGERSWLLNVDNSDEFGFAMATTAGACCYGKITTDVNITNGSTYRLCMAMDTFADTAGAWVNGTSRTIATYVNTINVTTNDASGPVYIGREHASSADGLDGEYAEWAVWSEKVPDWVCEAYGVGFSPDIYRKNRIWYAPLTNTSHVNDVHGATGTNTSGTDAAHPFMFYSGGGR